MKSCLVGFGQVGQGLYEVIKDFHETYHWDIKDGKAEILSVDVLHLCFPYSENFVEEANNYIDILEPKLTINHASVSVGTTEQLHGNVCYSPIRGKHPRLADGIRTFTKFIAGNNFEAMAMGKKYFESCGLDVYGCPEMRDLEFSKLMSNIRYGMEIAFMQEAERIAVNLGVNVSTFQDFERSYNSGYDRLGEPEMKRPILYGGIIGGHCLIQNSDIISQQYKSEMLDWLRKSNEARRNWDPAVPAPEKPEEEKFDKRFEVTED